jgi:hypothetical protein
MRVIVTNKIDDFTLETFIFTCLVNPTSYGIYLEEYIKETRDHLRSKYYIVDSYYKLQSKPSNLYEKDVPLTDKIKNKTLNAIMSRLEFKMLTDRKSKSKGRSL